MPRVSIIIPTYNYQQFVEQAIISVIKQTYRDFEIIVIDDGSTDQTRARLQPYVDRGEILYYFQNNMGLPGARNTGIKQSHGTLIAFLDADDLWTPDKLSLQVALFDQHPEVGFVFGNTRKFFDSSATRATAFEDIPPANGWVASQLLERSFLPMPTVMIRREAFDTVGVFNENLDSCEDLDMWLRLSVAYPCAYTDRVVAWYRLHSLSMSSNVYKIAERRLQVLTKFIDGHRPYIEAHGRTSLISDVLGLAYENAGKYALTSGHQTQGNVYLAQADKLLGENLYRTLLRYASLVPSLIPLLYRWKMGRLSRSLFRTLQPNELPAQ